MRQRAAKVRSAGAFRALAAAIAVAGFTGTASADGPVLHEYFAANPSEDVMLNATVAGGGLPAALDTPSGIVQAPDPTRPPSPLEQAYGGASTPDSFDATYRIDSDTTRPEMVNYDDPFTPAVTPFKRLFAYDGVSSAAELIVRDKTLRTVTVGGAASIDDDQFFGDMTVDLEKDVPVRIPTVGPGSRIINIETHPRTEFKLLADSAENLYIKATKRARVRLVMQLAIQRAVFGSPFARSSWSQLRSHLAPVPSGLRKSAQTVLANLGMHQSAVTPREAVNRLVEHFRSFAPSTERPASRGADLYRELALSKKGVCRHRAYAFSITASALGLPSRMVRNEAHAWVEIFDGHIWHRVDLGGAAGQMQTDQNDRRASHAPPPDPFTWPAGSESAADMAARAGDVSTPTDPDATGAGGSGSADDGSDDPAPPAETLPPPPSPFGSIDLKDQPKEDERPLADVTLQVTAASAKRGSRIDVSGRIEADGSPCARVRVDIGLRDSGDAAPIVIGSLATDADGKYKGSVVVPFVLSVGKYELLAATPGDARCGTGVGK